MADVDPNPGHADRADDRFLVLLLDPVVRDHPATRRAATRRQRRGELFVHLRRDVPAALRPVLGPTLPARFPGSRLRRALREWGRLALPRALGRRQLLLESVPLSAEPIPLGCQARALVLQAVPLVLQASALRVLLRTVAAQPSVGVLELFDAFPGRAAEDSHPRDDSRRQGFCPGLAEKPNVSAGSDPLFNYLRGLQIPMNDTCLMRRLQRLRNLLGDGQRLIDGDRPSGDPVGEGWSIDQLQDQRLDAV